MATDPREWMSAEACTMLERVEQMHRQFFRPGLPGMQAAAWQPPIDVFEAAGGLRVAVALPGVEIQDVDLAVDHDALVISSIRHLSYVARGANIQRLEIPYGRFEGQVQLPAGRVELGHPEIAQACIARRRQTTTTWARYGTPIGRSVEQ